MDRVAVVVAIVNVPLFVLEDVTVPEKSGVVDTRNVYESPAGVGAVHDPVNAFVAAEEITKFVGMGEVIVFVLPRLKYAVEIPDWFTAFTRP